MSDMLEFIIALAWVAVGLYAYMWARRYAGGPCSQNEFFETAVAMAMSIGGPLTWGVIFTVTVLDGDPY